MELIFLKESVSGATKEHSYEVCLQLA